MEDKTGQELKEHFEASGKQFTCPYCKGHNVILIDQYTNNIYEVACKSCGKLLILCPDAIHEEKENNTMKCQRCGKEMRNTIGGNYTCDECGFGINDLVYRGGRGWKTTVEWTDKDTFTLQPNTATTTTDGLAAQPTATNTAKATIINNSNNGFVQQGWQCPKCGAILSPSTSFCPFCSRQTFTPTITCGTSGEYVNPNVTTSISKEK
jgi:transcription elongation factor Elf1